MLRFFVMAAPLPQTRTILTWKMAAARQNRHLEQIPIPCGARATIVAAETSWTAIVPTPLILLERWLLSLVVKHALSQRDAPLREHDRLGGEKRI
jgi:hypothetical protein